MDSAKLIKEARERAGMTQGELAHMAGLSRQSVNYAETGRTTPRAGHFKALARALGVPPEDLGYKEPLDPETHKTVVIRGVLDAVSAGEMDAHEGLRVLQGEGIIKLIPRTGMMGADTVGAEIAGGDDKATG